MLLAHAVHDGFFGGLNLLPAEGRIFIGQAPQVFRDFGFIAATFRFDRPADHRRRIARLHKRRLPGLAGDRVADAQLFQLRRRHDVAARRVTYLFLIFALESKELGDLHRLTAVGLVDGIAGGDAAAEHADETQLADEIVTGHLENQPAKGSVRRRRVRLRLVVANRLEPVADLRRIGREVGNDVEQFRDTEACFGRAKQDRDHVAGYQRAGERAGDFFRGDFFLLEVAQHEFFVGGDD